MLKIIASITIAPPKMMKVIVPPRVTIPTTLQYIPNNGIWCHYLGAVDDTEFNQTTDPDIWFKSPFHCAKCTDGSNAVLIEPHNVLAGFVLELAYEDCDG